MDYDKGSLLLENSIKAFRTNAAKMYGQIALRIDDDTYITTGGNKILSEIVKDDFELCDISTGDLGVIFNARQDLNAIIVAISADIVQASSGESEIASSLEDIAQLAGSSIKIIGNTEPGTILSALTDDDVCLIRAVGAVAACSDIKRAVAAIHVIEKACEAENHGKAIGGTSTLDAVEAESLRVNYRTDYTKRNEEPHVDFIGFDEDEFSKRSDLIEYGKALVRGNLSYGSWGNLSVKLNDDEMLITPSSMDYFEIKPEDIVRVNLRTLDYGNQRIPSSEASMHAKIYLSKPDAGSIIHTHSNAISVFAACEAGFAITDPDLHNLIGDMLTCTYAPAGSDELAESVNRTMNDTHACIIPHHGAVFYGPTLDVVFAIADAVEQKARNLLDYDSIDSFADILDD